MEPEVDAEFTVELREAAAAAFGVGWSDLTLLGDFENYVYALTYQGRPAVLRVTHESHRSHGQVEAELHWLNAMRKGGVPFCPALASPSGELVVSVGEGAFHVAAFERAPGCVPRSEDLSVELFSALGRAIGRSHHLTGSYAPLAGSVRRPRWEEDAHIRGTPQRVPAEELKVLARHREVMEQLGVLPMPPEAFGLIHTDLHLQNFHWHEGELLAFDTDDCMYHWFLEDLSTVFYYSVDARLSQEGKRDFYGKFFPAFWTSYRREHELDPSWLVHIPLFMRLRCLTLYGLVQVKWPAGQRTDVQRGRLGRMRAEIESDEPYTDFDFRGSAES